jgi:hypothetical protein
MKHKFSRHSFEKYQMSSFMKIRRPLGTELFHADGHSRYEAHSCFFFFVCNSSYVPNNVTAYCLAGGRGGGYEALPTTSQDAYQPM